MDILTKTAPEQAQAHASIDNDLRKVTAVTTLCHLCTLSQLEQLVKDARKQEHEQVQTTPENTSNEIESN